MNNLLQQLKEEIAAKGIIRNKALIDAVLAALEGEVVCVGKKTKEQWDETELELQEFLQPLDEVDEDLYLYMDGVVCPQYVSPKFLQVGEADDKINGVYFYTTFMRVNDKFFYLGSLPEFMK